MPKSSQRKKPNITIISDTKTLSELKKWAGSRGLSMNALINDILAKNTFFYRYAAEHECMIIPSTIYSSTIDALTEKVLVEMTSRTASEMVQSIFSHNSIPYTMDNIIKFYFESVGIWSGLYSIFKQYNEPGSTRLVFEHKYGIKWSGVISQSISNLVKETLQKSSESKLLPNTVIITVDNGII